MYRSITYCEFEIAGYRFRVVTEFGAYAEREDSHGLHFRFYSLDGTFRSTDICL